VSKPPRGSGVRGWRNPRIILVDGHQLARLMVDYGVGVSTVETYELKRVNLDYFADEDDATTGPPQPPTLP
jgi:hypothetical protein